MNGEQNLKNAIFAPMNDKQIAIYIKGEAEAEVAKDRRNRLTREQQLEKALRFATGMLNNFMTPEQQRDNITLGYVRLVNSQTA